MPTPQRRQPVAVIDRLVAEPHRFDFFQAVRLLEQWFLRDEQTPRRDVLSQRLQFRNTLSLAFPASEIAEFKLVMRVPAVDGDTVPARTGAGAVQHVEMTPAFIGLLGAGGALPVFYTELFAQRETAQKDSAARAFMDIFLHRAVVLFYQAWRKHRLAIEFEADRHNRFLPLVLAVAGIGQPALRDRLHARRGGIADDALAYFAGALQQRPVAAATIRRVLAEYFAVGVALEPFVGRWFVLPKDNQTRLGVANAVLGGSAVASERVWQRDLRMRLTVGPMPRAQFRRFLPGGAAQLALREWLTLFTGVAIEYEVRLCLRSADVAPARLDADGPRLGWDSFLPGGPAHVDRCDPGYEIHAIA